MVDNLLDLTRIEGGTLHPDKSWYDLAELVADVANRPAVRSPDHPLRVDIQPDLPLVCFDYVKIAQVLVNLIENAVKYTPPGTPIVVTARAARDAVELAVTDSGPGSRPTSSTASSIPLSFAAQCPRSGHRHRPLNRAGIRRGPRRTNPGGESAGRGSLIPVYVAGRNCGR